MTRAAQARRRQRAGAARQALTLCEIEVIRSACGALAPASPELINRARPRTSQVAARAALRGRLAAARRRQAPQPAALKS